MTVNNSRKITLEITKGTVVIGVVLLFIGYLVGNVLPITGNFIPTQAHTQTIQTAQPNRQGTANTVNFNIPSFATARGSDSAKINVVEFGDYQCPFCEKFFQQVEPDLKQNYVDAGKTKFYFLDFQFLGPDSQTLGQGAWCAADQGLYYDYHDYVYGHQQQENSGWATPDKVKALAYNITGLDTQKFDSCLDSKKYESRVQQLTQMGQSLGVSGTPTVFVGNSKLGYIALVGAQPYQSFQQIIESQLAKS